MLESAIEKAVKAKALKKLMAQWLTVQGTERKAALILGKNPEIKPHRNRRKKTTDLP